MAESLDDGEFWLPPKFLNDDDLFLEEKCGGNDVKNGRHGVGLYPFEFPLGFGPFGVPSDLGSPVESLVGSSETESDEEEYIAGLTHQMKRSTLEDGFGLDNSHVWVGCHVSFLLLLALIFLPFLIFSFFYRFGDLLVHHSQRCVLWEVGVAANRALAGEAPMAITRLLIHNSLWIYSMPLPVKSRR